MVYPGGRPVPRRRSVGSHLALMVAGIAIIGIIAWLVAGAVFAIFHVIELFVVAALAGWAGYRVGRFRGRRMPR